MLSDGLAGPRLYQVRLNSNLMSLPFTADMVALAMRYAGCDRHTGSTDDFCLPVRESRYKQCQSLL